MASGPTQVSNARAQEAWAARPFAAGVIRTSILVAPIVVSLAVGFWAWIVAWNLWDPTHEAALGSGPDVTSGQSISVAIESAAAAQDSACWEPTASGDAAARCAGANLTQNLDPGADDNPNRVSSPGRPNY